MTLHANCSWQQGWGEVWGMRSMQDGLLPCQAHRMSRVSQQTASKLPPYPAQASKLGELAWQVILNGNTSSIH